MFKPAYQKFRYLSSSTLRSAQLPSRLAIAAASLAFPSLAFAQADEGLREIIVTAQKIEQNIQNVPISVTALDAQALEDAQVKSLRDISGLAPSVVVEENTFGSSANISIRGILGGSTSSGVDSKVAMYVDGVYLGRSAGASFDIADLERVEILRGPQGTLYGRNTTGGAVNFITAAPKGEFRARQEVTVGNLGRLRLRAHVDLPKIGDFMIAASYMHDEREGYVRNTEAGTVWNFENATDGRMKGDRVSPKWLGASNSESGMVAVRWAPTELPVTVDYKFDITSKTSTNAESQALYDTSYVRTPPEPSTERLNAVPNGFTTPEKLDTWGHSLTVTWDISNELQLKSITAYRGFTDELSAALGGGGVTGVITTAGVTPATNFQPLSTVFWERGRQISHETQLSYRSDLMDVVGGVYYAYDKTDTNAHAAYGRSLTPYSPGRTEFLTVGEYASRNKSIAGYLQSTVHLSEQVDLTGGARITKDIRKTNSRGAAFIGIPIQDFKKTFNHVDWMTNLAYRPNDDVMLYAKASTGYLSGGVFNGVPFNAEEMLQYEVGAKTEWLDRRVRINIAAFDSKYKNLQRQINDPSRGFLYIAVNDGKANIKGVEIEGTVIPADGLTLTANYGYTRYRIVRSNNPILIGNTSFGPKETLSLSANYNFPELGDGIKPSFNVSARYHSRLNFGGSVLPPAGATPAQIALSEALRDSAVWDIDARASLSEISFGGGRFTLSGWVRNLLDQRKIVNTTVVGPTMGRFKPPRTYGLDLIAEF